MTQADLFRDAPPSASPVCPRIKHRATSPDERQAAKRAAREARERELADNTIAASKALGRSLYGVILADPPWRFEPYSRVTGLDRSADNHYPTMTLRALQALQIPAAPDCVLFCWATPAMLPQALDVMAAWKFVYKSHLVWLKDKVGLGYWARNKHELLLIGTRGEVPAPAPGDQSVSVINAPRAGHSVKPQIFAEIIERLFPRVPKLEMFARRPRAGWDVWGNEVAAPRDSARGGPPLSGGGAP